MPFDVGINVFFYEKKFANAFQFQNLRFLGKILRG